MEGFDLNGGKPFSANAIVKFLKSEERSLSEESVYNYLEWLAVFRKINNVPISGRASMWRFRSFLCTQFGGRFQNVKLVYKTETSFYI